MPHPTPVGSERLARHRPLDLALQRRAAAEKALRAYLAELGAGTPTITIAEMAGAATQWLMCHSAPVIAAYARGELVSEDLGDRELRRLAGLEPTRTAAAAPTGADDGQVEDVQDLAFLRRQLRDRLPIWQLLRHERSPFRSYWYSQLERYSCHSAIEKLLCGFAAWLVAHEDPGADGTRLSFRQRQHIVRVVEVAACAVYGYADAGPDWRQIDGDTLSALAEVSREQFPDRLRHGAWRDFHLYLRDAKADHAGFEVGVLGPVPESRVSAKILSANELEQLTTLLRSPRSGIGNPELRTSAQRHVALMATYGMRRAESAYLRAVDYQDDLCRVQAYGEGDEKHTLKTAWAARTLPIEFAAEPVRNWVGCAREQGLTRLIDPDAETPAHPDNFFDALSRLVKTVTGDKSMGSHHLRHTLISRMLLTLLADVAGFSELDEAFPWVPGLLLQPAQLRALLGAEGDAGQGLRALSALVGHSHPTTTVRHYVHVLCIALYGALSRVDTLDLARSFERRLGGRSTVQRWATAARTAAPSDLTAEQRRRWINRSLRDRIEARCNWAGIDRDETPRSGREDPGDRSDATDQTPAWLCFDHLEQADRSFRERRELLEPEELAAYRVGLGWLAAIGSGKKGVEPGAISPRKGFEPRRHVLEEVDDGGIWIPPQLAAGSATVAAAALCTWLAALAADAPQAFEWLLGKWADASERERGRMRLDDREEVERAQRLPTGTYVAVRVTGSRVQVSRRRDSTKPVPHLRLKCLDRAGKMITRDTAAVRWVMSYVSVRRHVRVLVAAARRATSTGQPQLFGPPPAAEAARGSRGDSAGR